MTRRLFDKTVRVSVALVTLLWLACSDETSSPLDPDPTPNQVAAIDVTPATLVVIVGGQQKLTATAVDASRQPVPGAQVTWSSDASGIATVGQDGTVTGAATGTAHITASSAGKTASVTVTVVAQPSGNAIVLNPSIKYQTITGWEAVAQAGGDDPTFPLYRNQLFDQAVNDLGINRLRLEVRSGLENTKDYSALHDAGQIDDATWRCVRYATVNDDNDPNTINPSGFQWASFDKVVDDVVLPMKQRLEARGEKLFLNLNYVAFTKQICSGYSYVHSSPQEYAEFILAASLHLRSKYGLVPDAWEVILEPENTNEWRGKQIGDAVIATAAKLSANGFTPRFIAPSTTRSYNAVPYFDDMSAASRPYVFELSYHRYSSPTVAELQTIAARAKQNGIRTSMLEHMASDYEDLHEDLKYAQVSAWQQFTLAFPSTDNGAQYYTIDKSNPASPKVVIASRTKLLRQYFKFVRSGAVRIDATTGVSNIDPLAFINSDGKYVVVVKANAASSFGVVGLPAGTYGIKYTTSSTYNADLPDVTINAGQQLDTNIPQKGVITIYRK